MILTIFYLGMFFTYRKRENHVKRKHKILERKTKEICSGESVLFTLNEIYCEVMHRLGLEICCALNNVFEQCLFHSLISFLLNFQRFFLSMRTRIFLESVINRGFCSSTFAFDLTCICPCSRILCAFL